MYRKREPFATVNRYCVCKKSDFGDKVQVHIGAAMTEKTGIKGIGSPLIVEQRSIIAKKMDRDGCIGDRLS